jgi:pyruvate/2-oxoglutarate/acetoin dehydrogenase E1 component
VKYIEEVDKGMQLLADDNRTVIMGQAVQYKGHAVTRQAQFWPEDRRLELPVAEDFQTGMALGMSLEKNIIPVSIYPRMNFLICAANQLLNHIDKWAAMGSDHPHIILKAVVGSSYPLDPGQQHKADWAHELDSMCQDVMVHNLLYAHQVEPAYNAAISLPRPHLIIEHGDLY